MNLFDRKSNSVKGGSSQADPLAKVSENDNTKNKKLFKIKENAATSSNPKAPNRSVDSKKKLVTFKQVSEVAY